MAKKKDAFRKRVAVMLKVARQLTGLTLEDVGQKVGLTVEPNNIHVMKREQS